MDTALEEQQRRVADELLPDLLARVCHAVTAEFADELRRHGISVIEWRALSALDGVASGQSVSVLASVCLLQQPTMTKLLDRMTRDGLVVRMPDARDRRIVRVALTTAGRARVAEAAKTAVRYEARLLADYPGAHAIKDALRDASIPTFPVLQTSADTAY